MKKKFIIFPVIIMLAVGCGSPVTPPINTWEVEEMILLNQLPGGTFRDSPIEYLLKNEGSQVIRDPRLQTLFQRAKFSADTPISKGEIYGVVKLDDGTYKRLWISIYGGFFEVIDQKRKGFFRFEKDEDRNVWNELIFGN